MQPSRPQLSEAEILLIISAILFLTLLLLGICCAYYCLKRRNIKVIRKKKAVSGMGSEITKLSGSTMGPLSVDQFRIPRAVPPSYSGSEAAILTSASGDTIPSDYPSESPSTMTSDIDEYDMRRGEIGNVRQEHTQFVNAAYSADEDQLSAFPSDKEPDIGSVSVLPALVVAKPDPKLHERFLTTVVERENVRTEEDIDDIHAVTTQYHLKEDLQPALPPPVIITREEEVYDETNQMVEHGPPKASHETQTLADNDLMTETLSVSEFKEDKSFIRYMSLPRSSEGDALSVSESEMQIAIRNPKLEVKNTEDTFLTTTTDIHETEIVTKHSRDTIEFHSEHKNPEEDGDWDVIIRTYPPDTADVGVGPQNSLPPSRTPSLYSERPESVKSDYSERSRMSVSGWDVLIRVLQPPSANQSEFDDLPLNEEDKDTLRRVIKTDSTFRTLIQEATTYEELVSISRDVRYEYLFEREKWEVIIRVLSQEMDYIRETIVSEGPPVSRLPRYRKNEDTRSHRGPLPPVYESNGNFISGGPRYPHGSMRSRRTTQSNRDYDMRSMTEEEVNFARADRESIWSADTAQSIAERSTSEYLEDIPTFSSTFPRHPRSLERSTSEFVTTADSIAQDKYAERQSAQWNASFSGHNRRVLERSSTEYIEDVPTITLDDMAILDSRRPRSRSGSIISASSGASSIGRYPAERSRNVHVINSPIIRAMDLASAGDREESRSVTETYRYDWGR